jgi:uncharacterized protein YdhG (YjbR/CyaY superfamily)
MKVKATSIDDYIRKAPEAARQHLVKIRGILEKVAPKAVQALKWGNPVFEENRILFAFAAFRNHMNFMPGPAAIEAFEKELSVYRTGKGTVQFPYDKPLPAPLIRKIAAWRAKDVRENDARWM